MFNDIRVVFLSLDFHIQNPLYLPMKLSFFSKETLESKQGPHNRFYVLLHHNVADSATDCDEEHILESPEMQHFSAIQELCLINNVTLLTAWSLDEAASYLGCLKQWGSKKWMDSSNFLGENKRKHTHSMRAVDVLASVCKLNETNAV